MKYPESGPVVFRGFTWKLGVSRPYSTFSIGDYYINRASLICQVMYDQQSDKIVGGFNVNKPEDNDYMLPLVKGVEVKDNPELCGGKELRSTDMTITEKLFKDVVNNEMFTTLQDRAEVFIKLDDLNGSSKIVHLGDPYSGRYDGTSKFYPSRVVRVITPPMEV